MGSIRRSNELPISVIIIYERQKLHNDLVGFITAAVLGFLLITDLGKINVLLLLSHSSRSRSNNDKHRGGETQ